MSRRPAFASLLLACALAGAAAPSEPAPSRTVWRDEVTVKLFRDRVLTQAGPAAKAQERSLPPGALWASWRPEGLYALVTRQEAPPLDKAAPDKAAEPPKERLQVLVDRGQGWELFAALPPGLGQVRAALPMKDGRLFLVPGNGLLSNADQTELFPFAILGPDAQGRWTRLEPVNLEWGAPFTKKPGPKGEPIWTRNRKYTFVISEDFEAPGLQERLFELASGWAFLDRHHGLVWVFGEDGQLLRRVGLYDELKDEDLDKPFMSFPTGVLACEPAPRGRLWIAGRNPTAFFFSRMARPLTDAGNQVLPAEAFLERQRLAAKEFPELQWWEVDTATGQAWQRPAPAGAPTRYKYDPADPNWHFHFRVDAEGRLGFEGSELYKSPVQTPDTNPQRPAQSSASRP